MIVRAICLGNFAMYRPVQRFLRFFPLIAFSAMRWCLASKLGRVTSGSAVLLCAVACQSASSRLLTPARRSVHPEYRQILQDATKDGLEIRSFQTVAEDGVPLSCLLVRKAASHAGKPVPSRLQAYWQALPPKLQSAAPGSSGTVILLHGFQNNKEQWLPRARELAWSGFSCVLFDSRAHGTSGGKYATFGHKEANDVKYVWATARQSFAFPNPKLSLLGYSMGGAVALQSLDLLPEVQAVATISTFDRLDRVLWDQSVSKLRWLTRPALRAVAASAKLRSGMDLAEIRPCDCVARHPVRLMVIHGAEDRLVHPQAAEVLQKSAKGACRKILLPGKNHWAAFYDAQPQLHAEIAGFFHSGP